MSKTIKLVRYGELKPCKTAFIDAHTPGSDQKENFTIIGGGVSESPDQHVHINDKIGFNIGAAGQPPKCRNSLHDHHTAEVFFVAKGRWRFFWGRYGDAAEVVLEEGDIFNIPTGIFRGFENIGTDYGMIMAILGGNDAGGGVMWAPQVIEEAQNHGLILGDNGVLYDTKKGATLPPNIKPMPLMSDEELAKRGEPKAKEVLPNHVARYWDMMAMAKDGPVHVIGENALLRDKPGFDVTFLSRDSSVSTTQMNAQMNDHHTVLMPIKGHWRITTSDFDAVISCGDTALIQPNANFTLSPSMSGEASLYQITPTDDPAGLTWVPNA